MGTHPSTARAHVLLGADSVTKCSFPIQMFNLTKSSDDHSVVVEFPHNRGLLVTIHVTWYTHHMSHGTRVTWYTRHMVHGWAAMWAVSYDELRVECLCLVVADVSNVFEVPTLCLSSTFPKSLGPLVVSRPFSRMLKY